MKAQLTPIYEAIKDFLDKLAPEGVVTFQTFDDRKGRKSPSLARVLHGTLDEHFVQLTRLQQQGAGAFVMVNRGDGLVHSGEKTCRTANNVVAVRSLFVDLDGAPLEPVLKACRPDIVVESSPGRYHGYWLADDCRLDEFSQHQKLIAHKFNGDPSVHDLPRVMRLPGCIHQKAEPFMTRIMFPE